MDCLFCKIIEGVITGGVFFSFDYTGYLTKEETELRGLAESVIARLYAMSDLDFHMLQDSLIPDFS